ncbi:MAG: ATP-binding protein, partial [Muribaculaceae bacterium]|nr:ATP-binding protein [Muribaculaceae bacterium]
GELSAFTARFAEVVKLPAPKLRPLSLPALVCGERRFLESLGVPKGVAMEFIGLDEEAREISGDSDLLVQVLVNIVKNSVESILMGGAQGRITIKVADNELTVTDNGVGISAEKASRLFTPFFTDKPHGQGIGLMLIREVLVAHNARFSLATSVEDGLTRFTVKFPWA